jgi:hypothetical protein
VIRKNADFSEYVEKNEPPPGKPLAIHPPKFASDNNVRQVELWEILFAKEGEPMRTQIWSSVIVLASLQLIGGNTSRVQAGSFFGPCCYGSKYTDCYPGRSHNAFGSLNGTPCKRWHPLWGHWFNKYRMQLESCGCGGVAAAPIVPSTVAPPLAQSAQIVPPGQ